MGIHGVPEKFYSDNAAYFKSADKEIKKLLRSIDFNEVAHDMYLGTPLQWEFSTPEAPWTAGVIERIIGMFKKLFRIAINYQRNVSLATVKTLASEVMNVLNNRPLDAEVDANGGLQPITPNKLVFGRNLTVLTTPSEQQLRASDIEFKDEWIIRKNILVNFWQKWTRQYLQQLSIRQKWEKKENVTLNVDDIVLLRDETMAASSWNIGRVVELHYDNDKNLTKAKVQLNTKNKVWRHLRQLALLESAASFGIPQTSSDEEPEAPEVPDTRPKTRQASRLEAEVETDQAEAHQQGPEASRRPVTRLPVNEGQGREVPNEHPMGSAQGDIPTGNAPRRSQRKRKRLQKMNL